MTRVTGISIGLAALALAAAGCLENLNAPIFFNLPSSLTAPSTIAPAPAMPRSVASGAIRKNADTTDSTPTNTAPTPPRYVSASLDGITPHTPPGPAGVIQPNSPGPIPSRNNNPIRNDTPPKNNTPPRTRSSRFSLPGRASITYALIAPNSTGTMNATSPCR